MRGGEEIITISLVAFLKLTHFSKLETLLFHNVVLFCLSSFQHMVGVRTLFAMLYYYNFCMGCHDVHQCSCLPVAPPVSLPFQNTAHWSVRLTFLHLLR